MSQVFAYTLGVSATELFLPPNFKRSRRRHFVVCRECQVHELEETQDFILAAKTGDRGDKYYSAVLVGKGCGHVLVECLVLGSHIAP